MENLFYEIIQVALGQREKLSRFPSEQEWTMLFALSQKQAVVGVAFKALDRLSQQGQKPPRELLYKWFGVSEQIRHNNLSLTKHCCQLQLMLQEKGQRSSVLKGQGIALYYDEPLRELRQTGDIDIYVNCGRSGAIDLARQLGEDSPEWDYKHLHLKLWKGVEIEMHYRVEVLLNLRKNRKLQRWFNEHNDLIHGLKFNVDGGEIVTPTIEFNVFYILLHIYRHFLYEGIGLRQIIDYYFVLKANNNKRPQVALDAVKLFGMEKFAKGLMWLMREVLGMSREWMPWEPNQKEGEYILAQVMEGGNFGHHDQRLTRDGGKVGAVKAICKHNWHLISHYPQEIIWPPIWFVYHKCWKMTHKTI